MRKLKINSHVWDHHRSGWKYVVSVLEEHFHNENGILCEGIMEGIFQNDISLPMPWIGFSHATPYVFIDNLERHDKKYFLEGVFSLDSWQKSIDSCQGIFTFSQHTARIIRNRFPIPVMSLKHPTFFPSKCFTIENYISNKEKTLVFVGDWLRNISSIYNINFSYKKVYLDSCVGNKNRNINEYQKNIYRNHNSVTVINRLEDDLYDEFLSKNIVFTHLYEASANNTVLECIVRNVPILVNKLPAVMEYLGNDYPLFFDNLEEAEAKVNDLDMIEKAYRYLVDMNKDDFRIESFIRSIEESGIYNFL